MYVLYPLAQLYSCSLLSLSLFLSLAYSSEAWLALLLSYQKNAATADFNGGVTE